MTFAGGVIWISWIFYIFGRAVWGRRISMLSSWFQINWIKIVDEEQRSHGLRKRSKASVKEQEERTVKKSAHKKKQWKEKSERRFDMDPPSLRCLLCDAFIFFWEGGDQRFFVLLFFSFSLFLLFFLFLCFFFFSSERAEIRGVFLLRHRALNFFLFFLHFSSSWRAKTRRGFLLCPKH